VSKLNRQYFGTDGIRGKVGKAPINAEFFLKLGWAAGRVLTKGESGKVLIGKDTRISGYMFESALQAGLSAAGVDVRLLGPMPTPAIAYLTRTLHAKAGIVISASHNPYFDNGIKFFAGDGAKLPDDVEMAIEAEMANDMVTIDSARLGKAERVTDAPGRYIEFCKSTIAGGLELRGLKIVVDCANGATYYVAPSVFSELGAEVIRLGTAPDGLNINQDCGSTAPKALQAAVLAHGADLGIALDGDGDRVIMVDHKGELLDGDELLFIIARSRMQYDGYTGGVVGTLMSNLGLELALQRLGIAFKRSAVGDRYVMALLKQQGWMIGGESSGHILCLDRLTTGDGIVAALQVLAMMLVSECTLNELKIGMTKLPQCMINVPLVGQINIKSDAITRAVANTEAALEGAGRVLLRPSGTEPVIRVMVEGRDAQQVKSLAALLAEKIGNVH